MPRGRPAGSTTRRKLEAKPSQSKKPARRSRVSKKLPQAPTPPTPGSLELEETTQLDFDVNSIQNYDQLMSALQAKKVQITLGNNIIAPENILINYDVAINLNGFSIISEESVESARVLDIRSGAVTLTGQGKIFAMGPRSVAIRVFGAISAELPDYTTLTIDEGISIFAPDAYGILISPNLGVAYGLTVNFAGQIFARDGICLASGINGRELNLPVVNLGSSASIVVDEATGAAIEASGYGKWQISTAHLRGAKGASLRSGVVEFSNTQIMASVGAVFQLEDAAEPALEVIVDGGNYVSEQSQIFAGTSAAVKKFVLKNGEFYGQTEELPAELKSIVDVKKAAHFRTDVIDFLNNLSTQAALATQPDIAADSSIMSDGEVDRAASLDKETTDDSKDGAITNLASEPTSGSKDATKADLAENAASGDNAIELEEAITTKANSETDLELSRNERFETETSNSAAENSSSSSATENLTDDELAIMAAFADAEAESRDVSALDESELTDDELIELAFAETAKPKKKSTKTRKTKTKKPKTVPKAPVVIEPLSSVPELTDSETDEDAIMLALTAEKVEPNRPVFAPPRPIQPVSEQDAARVALAEAINDIRKLSAEDYDVGFSELEQAIQHAEAVLANPLAELSHIRDAASNLLLAFDGLEERDEFSLSDAELDELFYHGAVLGELAKPSNKTQPSARPTHATSKALDYQDLPSVPTIEQNSSDFEPDFTVLSDVLNTISELKLENYTEQSRMELLQVLDQAQAVLTDMTSPQSAIDEIATNLLGVMAKLEPLRVLRSPTPNVRLHGIAPTLNVVVPAAMMDEASPSAIWSQGITMIDEMEPYLADATTQEKLLRAMKPWIVGMAELATEPMRRLRRSLAAGFRAGISAYRETLSRRF